jgi:hypothetical protein
VRLLLVIFGHWRLFHLMLLMTILNYCKLFHIKLLLFIVDYFTFDYFWQFKVIIIYDCWWLLVVFLLGLGPIKPTWRYTWSKYIILATNYVIKWVEVKTLKINTTIIIIIFLYECIVTRFRSLLNIITY